MRAIGASRVPGGDSNVRARVSVRNAAKLRRSKTSGKAKSTLRRNAWPRAGIKDRYGGASTKHQSAPRMAAWLAAFRQTVDGRLAHGTISRPTDEPRGMGSPPRVSGRSHRAPLARKPSKAKSGMATRSNSARSPVDEPHDRAVRFQ